MIIPRQISSDPVDLLSEEKTLCVHLRTIYEHLLAECNFKPPLFGSSKREKGGPWINYLKGRTYDLSQLQNKFALPGFIKVDERDRSIGCSRCWCDIKLMEF